MHYENNPTRIRGYPHSPGYKRRLLPGLSSWRPLLLNWFIVAGFGLVIGYAFFLQVIDAGFLREKGETRYLRKITLNAERGRIVDRNGELLAISTQVWAIWAYTPNTKIISKEQSARLSQLLQIDSRRLEKKLRKKRGSVLLKRYVDQAMGERILALRLPGISAKPEYRRSYPIGRASAHIVGLTNRQGQGQEGLELAYQHELQARPGSRLVIKRGRRIVQTMGPEKASQQGSNVKLAIDKRIQHMAYTTLKKAVRKHRAKAASAIVVDSRSGEILALANLPTFDPNDRSSLKQSALRNRAVVDMFDPGSTLKPLSVALALEKQPGVTARTVIDISPGWIRLGKRRVGDLGYAKRNKSKLTVQEIIQYSSNVGMIRLTEQLPAQTMWEMLDKLGFGKPLHIGFPGEAGGRMRDWKHWHPVDKAAISYGYGISTTLVQLVHAYLPLARSGETIPLSILKRTEPAEPQAQVFKPETAQTVRAILETVVKNGTGVKASVAGYRIGGKSGTARKLDNRRRYTKKYVASFVGIAPLSNPRLIVGIVLDEPAGKRYHGGEVAAPAFSALTQRALRLLAVPQDGVDGTFSTARVENRS